MTINRKLMIIMILSLFSLLLLTSCGHIGIGTGLLYTNTKTNFVSEYEEITSPKPMLNLSYVKSFDKFVINTSTNRLGNNARIRTIKINNREMQAKTTANIDTIALGYSFGNLTPYFVAGNVLLKTEARYKGRTIKTDNETALIYGTALSYRFSNQTISINLIAPSKALNLRYGAGIGYNFYI